MNFTIWSYKHTNVLIMAKSIVSIEVRGKSYGVRFSYAGSQHRLGLGLPNSSIGKLKALEIASQIERDMLLGSFDIKALQTYKPSYQEKLKAQEAIDEQTIIILVWNRYLAEKELQETTRKGHYAMVDKAISMYGNKDAETFIDAVKGSYAASTQNQIFKGLRAAFNYYAKKYDKTLLNPFSIATQESKAEIPESKRSKQAYRIDEAMSIINSFATGEYATIGYEHHDMHYTRLVSFLFNTGCRIEDALALTWDCIDIDFIEFSKSYSKGIHKSTKNEKTRHFPLTDKLRDIIGDIEGKKPTDLVFPAIKGGYINLTSWRRSYWQRIINALMQDGKVRKYLPPYHTRHTFISIQRENGVPDAVIADWVESSESMITKHYSDSQSEKYKPSVI